MDFKKIREKDREKDDFWDIDALIPPKRAVHYSADTETTEIVLEPKNQSASSKEATGEALPKRHFIPPHNEEERRCERVADDEYFPKDSLLQTVRIFRPHTSHTYYDSFIRDAERLLPIKGKECTHVPFFSYVPQYTQMTRAQLEWYLWWRENFQQGTFLSTDYSYLLLYAYELINLSEKTDPLYTQGELCKLWIEYRDVFHQLDSYLPEWICDHAMIHHLMPPDAFRGKLLYMAMSRCSLKEFYITASGEDGLLRGLLVFCSNYDFHKSKFCTKENERLFEKIILGAAKKALESMTPDGSLLHLKGMDTSRMVRDAYNGALCAYRVKRQIAVEYSSFHCSHDLRYLITDIVKYTENQLRFSLGIRSRLSIYALPVKLRECLDAYLATVLPKRTANPEKKPQEAYEKLYELPKKEFSRELAKQIEERSWQTTERLVEAFEDEDDPSAEAESAEAIKRQESGRAEEDAVIRRESDMEGALRRYYPFLSAVLREDIRGQHKCAAMLSLPSEIVADKINEIAADYIGDILLEESGNGFSVLDDYLETVRELLKFERND